MKKRISCIVLSLLLVLCFVPTTVMATDGDPNTDPNTENLTESKLTFFSLTIKPILGSTVGVVPNSSGVASQFLKMDSAMNGDTPLTNDEKGNLAMLAYWYKIADENYTGVYADDEGSLQYISDSTEVFQDGYHYYVKVFIYNYSTSGLLPFKEGAEGTINGEEVTVERMYNNTYLSFGAYVDVLGFKNIDMKITAPSLGKVADYKPSHKISDEVNDEVYGPRALIKSTWYKVEKDTYKGVEDSEWEAMEEDEEYTTGYYYMVKFDVLEENISDSNERRTISKNLTGTLNGNAFDKIVVDKEIQISAELYKIFEPLSEPEPIKSYDSKDTNQDGVIDCSEEMNDANWIWSNTKKACVYKVSNTSVK